MFVSLGGTTKINEFYGNMNELICTQSVLKLVFTGEKNYIGGSGSDFLRDFYEVFPIYLQYFIWA